MPRYKIYLDDRGANVNVVHMLEDNYCGGHGRSVPYLCCSTDSKPTADSRVKAFQDAGATARVAET